MAKKSETIGKGKKKSKIATDVKSVSRSIFFYRIDLGVDAKGNRNMFPTAEVLAHINSLPFQTGERDLDTGDEFDSALRCWVPSKTASHAILGKSRKGGFPEVGDNKGMLSPLEIPEESGLVEKMHVVFFGHNIIGSDFNFFGPRASALQFYLRNKGGPALLNMRPLKICVLFRKDVTQELKRLSDISLFRFRLKAPAVDALEKIDKNLHAAFKAQRDQSNAGEIEIIVKKSRKENAKGLSGIAAYAKKLMANQEIAVSTTALKVSGYSSRVGRTDEVDLLNDQLISKKTILVQDGKSRVLKESSVFDAIRSAYAEMEADLLHAYSLEDRGE